MEPLSEGRSSSGLSFQAPLTSEVASGVDLLERVVREACSTNDEWPARVAAGVRAAVEFVVDHPAPARALALDLDQRHHPVIERFSQMLAAETPPEERPKSSTERALVGGIASVIAGHIRSGSNEQLEERVPDLIHFALLPYLGFNAAKRWI
jgi:hypothetical protein